VARPLLCAGLSVLLLLATASSARALAPPILTGTNPASPGASLSPRVQGLVEESETKAAGPGIGFPEGPIARDFEPNNTVRLYTVANCAGPVVGEDTVATLQGLGVLVDSPVTPDSVTTFYATQSNETETSECSPQGLPYRQVSTPPGTPVLESVNPASPANQNFPRLLGSADPDATVSIYASPDCSGAIAASGSGAQFGSGGIQAIVADNSETAFSARATMAGLFSACSAAPIVYREVTPGAPPGGGGGAGGGGSGGAGAGPPASLNSPPPRPQLRTIPGGWANNNTPLLTGAAPGAVTVLIYADSKCGGSPVAKGSLEQFLAGLPVRVLDNAVTTFSAVAMASGKASGCSDPVVYAEDSLTPRTRITMAPAAKTAKRKAVVRFVDTTGNLPGTTFLCRVDKRKWKQCTSPLRIGKLRPRTYVVRVKATDPAGNVEGRGAKRRFKVVPRP